MAKVMLQIAKSENDFVHVMSHWEINPDQDVHQTSRELAEYNLRKSSLELALDPNTFQYTICCF